MKPEDEPMALADLELMLDRAAKITNHRRFVVAGSLSILGAVITPPPLMVMSRDLDTYPQLDPGRGFEEIATQMGEQSQFAREHGYYVDPITPALLALPGGWEARLAPIMLGSGVVAFFIEPNDVAVSKLARGNENDRVWVKEGISAGIINIDVLRHRGHHVAALDARESAELRARIEDVCAPVMARVDPQRPT